MITQKAALNNLRNIWYEVSNENQYNGARWYVEAHLYCVALAEKYNQPLESVVGCLAVLSPNCSWKVNKESTEEILRIGSCSGNVYPDNVKKALSILHYGMDPYVVMSKNKRSGNKVRSFYKNILSPKFSDEVTVDTHATRAAFDMLDLTIKHIKWIFGSAKGYRTIASAYQSLAKELGLRPCEVQAAIWLTVKDKMDNGR